MTNTNSTADGVVPARHSRSRAKKLFIAASYVVYLVLLLLIGAKLFWYFAVGVPVTRGITEMELWHVFYPNIRTSGLRDAEFRTEDDFFDVLVLGGSVMDQAAEGLERSMRNQMGDRLRFFNLAEAAHTSRDSFLKLQLFKDRKFDLVIVYNGINDVAMANVPTRKFREDYTHCSWYASIRDRIGAGRMNIRELAADRINTIVRSGHSPEELLHGNVIKTDVTVKANVEGIVKMAARHQTPVVIMTFASYIPDGYHEDLFRRGELDYGDGINAMEVEYWGRPENVEAALAVQNRELEAIALRSENAIFIDVQQQMPASGVYFCDVCHMTVEGRELFVRHIMAGIAPLLKRAGKN